MTSPLFRDLATDILTACLEKKSWPSTQLRRLLEGACDAGTATAFEASQALFQILVEGLADRFEPGLSELYGVLFSEVIGFVDPGSNPVALVSRYARVRRLRPFLGRPERVRRVFVLSRVTLGADIAVTSVMLDAAKRCFPDAAVWLVGGEKSRQLFAADRRIEWLPVSYGRAGTLSERLAAVEQLPKLLGAPGSIVIDPDSRLTQLGLLPVCPEETYHFFDSRSYGGDGEESLTQLAQRWVEEVFGVPGAAPYIAPLPAPPGDQSRVIVNLGVGENPLKRVPEPFEAELLRGLVRKGAPVVIDLGAGGEEEERVRRAIAACGAPESQVQPWRGSFATLAAMIATSSLYVGYDSAGQHAAAVCGAPLVTVFAGFSVPRMLARWTPTGPGPKAIVRVDRPDPREVLDRTLAAIDCLLPGLG